MGFELSWFTDDVDKEFLCPICMMVVEDPCESSCEHVYCSKCIKGWVAVDKSCPVDRTPLDDLSLGKANRFYRNLWGRLRVKCPLDSMGCDFVMPLESLQVHLDNCLYQPNMMVLCDKGCRLKMTRFEYQKNCSAHVSNFLSNKFERQVHALRDHIGQLNEQIERQADSMSRLIARTPGIPPRPTLSRHYNMNLSLNDTNILEPYPANRFCWAFAQYTPISQAITSFRFQVVSIADGEYVVIGLTHSNHIDEMPGHRVGSIGYSSRGELVLNGIVDVGLLKWKNGDIVECGVQFSERSWSPRYRMGDVYFKINETIVSKKRMKIPNDGFYPTIRMGTFVRSVPKVEYLTH